MIKRENRHSSTWIAITFTVNCLLFVNIGHGKKYLQNDIYSFAAGRSTKEGVFEERPENSLGVPLEKYFCGIPPLLRGIQAVRPSSLPIVAAQFAQAAHELSMTKQSYKSIHIWLRAIASNLLTGCFRALISV